MFLFGTWPKRKVHAWINKYQPSSLEKKDIEDISSSLDNKSFVERWQFCGLNVFDHWNTVSLKALLGKYWEILGSHQSGKYWEITKAIVFCGTLVLWWLLCWVAVSESREKEKKWILTKFKSQRKNVSLKLQIENWNSEFCWFKLPPSKKMKAINSPFG